MTITCKPLYHKPTEKEWPNPLLNPWYYQERDFTPLVRTLGFALQDPPSKPAASWISPCEGGSSNQTCPKESIVLSSNAVLPSGPTTHPATCHPRSFSFFTARLWYVSSTSNMHQPWVFLALHSPSCLISSP